MSTAKLIIWACVLVLVFTCSAADTHSDWPDEDEEDTFEKDIAIDQLRIHDYSRFYSQYGNRVKPGTSPAFNFTVQDLPVPREDPVNPNDGFTYKRRKREVDDDIEYSGDDPCEGDPPPCPGLGQTCVFNASSPDGYHCECAPGFEKVYPNHICTEIPETQRVYVTTPLDTPTYNTELNNNKSVVFQEFQRECDRSFTDFFRNIMGFVALRTLEFREGTQKETIVVYVLYFTRSDTTTLVSVAKSVLRMESDRQIVINGTMYQITKASGIFLTFGGTSSGNDDFNWCSDPTLYSCDGDTICVDGGLRYTCDCKPGFVNISGQCTDEKVFQYDLYPYGYANGDQLLPEGDDEVFVIDVTSGIPFADRTYYSFYLGINGLITFDQRDSGLNVQLYNHIKMFSPYQADIITRGGYGQIWYKIYSRRRDATTLFEKADKEIMEFLDLKKFKAKLVIVITWDRVSHYSNRNINNRVTFQTVLASNGEMSYALVYYKKDSMLWDPRVTTNAVMGYSDGKKRPNSIIRSPYSYTLGAITSMGTLQGNTGRQGTWAYKVGEKYSPDQICDDWYQTYLPNVGFYHSLDSWIPRCPCNFHQLGWRWTFHRYINEINALCFNIQYSSGWRFHPYGRDCCYSITGNFWTWVQGIPYAGGITAYNPTYNLQFNKEHDRDPHDACCGPSSTIASCMKYYTLRPYGWCTTVPTSEDAWSWGDPHILTLDGVEYTFNGWGEYTMLKVHTENVTFNLQCRTDRAETENGTQTDATIFSAFAMAENGVRVFVQLDPNDNRSLIIYANGSDESRNFRDRVNFTLQTTAFSLRRDNNSLGVLFGASGIGITVVPGIKALDISVDMPIIFRNQTKGLLGNFNGNQLDDFILPNGTVLPSNMTDRQKFEDFGSHWAISSNESLFRYENRLGPANYSHPDFKPIFLDEFSQEIMDNASTVCGGKDKLACIYDYLVTGNKEVAEATKQFQETASDVNLANRNTVPELNATGIVNATGNSPIEFQLIGEDQDNDPITYYSVGNISNNVILDNRTGLVKYTPNIHEPVYLSFYVVDSKNAASSVVVVPVSYCSGCSGNGVCDENNLRNGSTQAFQIASCVCHVAWTGEECDQDRDACLENPCVSGQNCTDLTPDQQGNSPIGYNCSGCPRGFEVNTTTNKCQDVDECFVDNVCGQICNNTEGSFLCSCNHGYRLGVDGKSCLDINECAEKTDGCGQICTNYPGGFNCSCHLGYIYQDMNKTCVQDSQTATNCSNFNCTQECRMANGNPECFCLQGYTLLDDNRTCADIDECRQSICSQGCNNTVGSFTCTCYVGYQLDSDKTTCNECPDMYYGQNCIQVCNCNGRNTGCDKVRGCICGSGWTGSFCERDIDECQETPNICGNVREVCVNTNGSYRCDCQSGYTRGPTQSCIDINECDPVTGLNSCGALEDCVNTDGSYYCTCKSGYYKHSGNSNCTDIDECGSSDLCEQICMNTDGSYNCECNYGYRLNVDRYSCLKVADPCKDEEGLTCDQGCTLLETNKAICFCLNGYRLGPDSQSCVDIDECASINGGCSHTCRNTPGSFQCTCPVGFRMDNDRKTCLACGTGTYGENCANNCACGVGANRCDSVSGCVCSSGWIGSRCDQDIDECQTLSVVQECQNKNAKCINFPGNYSCDCETGYQQNPSGICEDTDECLDFPCGQTCENFPGGYRCLCNRGFTLDDEGNCKDEDECALPTTNRCQQQCINTIGSYFCHCNQQGYELDNDGFSCTARVTCHNNTCPSLNGGCSVVNGTDTCFCHSGYYYNQTINNCTEQVLSWCQHAGCQYNCSEIQELPRFQCQCPGGYLLNDDQKTCRMCAAGTFGQNCSSHCICDAQNTVNCSNFDGTCTCKSGWNGMNCDQDINECAQSPPPSCVANSTCSNTNGSYLCVCNIGFQKLTDGNCQECTGNSYGDNCGSPCPCNVTNTVSCHHVTGNCTCRQGWEGLTCDKDIDECSLQTTNNCNGQHENCTNTIGSYYCVCNSGYQYNTSMACEECTGNTYGTNCKDDCLCNVTNTVSCHHVTGLCTCRQEWEGATCDTDIDECLMNASTCNGPNETCNNILGGYECLCLDGYQKDAFHICRECTNNTYGKNCSHQCQCNLDNTESCDHVAGNCTCKIEWEGPTCDTDIDECVTNTYNCSDPHATCNNTVGGYDCLCVDGYQKDSSGICEQCANNTFGTNCSHKCQCNLDNTVSCDHVTGNCTCKVEWEGPTCDTDIDECVTNTYNCSDSHETCNNTVGGYDCLCQDGYQKNSYGICEPCTNNTYGSNCSSQCQCNIITTVSCHHVTGNCTCQQGWTGAACEEDIDECSVNASICNGPHEVCNNALGGYDCLCVDGYQKNGTNTCTACTAGTFGTNCSSNCTCVTQNTDNCSNVDGTCTCKSGWNGTNCDQDIDECAQSPPPSCVANSTCSNTNGSYACVCNPGFHPLPDGTCTDSPECSNNTYGPNCTYQCQCNFNNTVSCHPVTGNCTCQQGWTGSTCDVDIDECSLNASICNGPYETCNNTLGGYDCLCMDGYQKNGTNTCTACTAGTFGTNCSSNCTCVTQNTDNCSNVDGTCTCKSGWNGTNCDQDVNECLINASACNGPNETCNNTLGGYECVCLDGYQKDVFSICRECTNNTYGSNCSSQCQCNIITTVSCHHVTGNCTCQQGWTGAACDVDIDECSVNVSICYGPYETCNNTLGGYDCLCVDGYQKNGTNTCTACTAGTFGTNCSSVCTCAAQNTVNCSNVDGTCTCKSGWNGTNCDQDIDECAQSPPPSCVDNSTCSNTNGSYLCVCNPGFHPLPDGTCTDSPECFNNTYGPNCTYQCQCNFNNTVSCHPVTGNCTCSPGWADPRCDTDIDECSTDTHNCSDPLEVCINTIGGYDCVCTDGYEKNISNSCQPCASGKFGTNCSSVCTCAAENTVNCSNVNGTCTCKSGWNGANCDEDIDECAQSPPPSCVDNSTCSNTNGSYLCVCNPGFHLLPDGTCTDSPECSNNTYGPNCTYQCQCNFNNTVSCHPVIGNCTCQQGWTGATCDVDIDECSVNASICNGPYETCNNTLGGYDCLCMDGYQKNGTNTCTACMEGTFGTNCSSNCTCVTQNTDNCSNVDGTCTCKSGWTGMNCDQDIDECAQSPPPSCVANSTCSNTNGSYLCVCNPGFHPLPDGTCTDSPECFNNTYGPNCTYQCQCNFNNTVSCHPVTGNCTCRPGWADPRCDTDIDECSTDTHNCSDPLEACVNTIGGYDCVCIDGYEKNISNSCQPCASGKFGTNCSSVCTCAAENTVNCSNVNGTCTCKSGWNGANCDEDIDECAQSPPPSCVANSTCSNTNGSYLCVCNPGFHPLPDGTCTDSPECSNNTYGPNCTYQCQCNFNNTVSCHPVTGNCTCQQGWTGATCDVDIDECSANVSICNGPYETCNNTLGGYDCLCVDGYQKNGTNTCTACTAGTFGTNCSSNCTCVTQNTDNCSNVDGTCTCKSGWTGMNCDQDIDECAQSPPPSCVANSTCSNTNGSYLCVCNPGFHPLPDGTCTDSPECFNNTYGPNCTYQCQCNFNNTVSCHPVTGNCTCSPGWADPRCDTDIDECSTDTHNCSDPLEVCINTIGGYDCVCIDGYEKNISNSCEPCASGKFGTNCSSVCTCAAENTVNCSNVNGTCTCKSGWNGANCDEDIDECAQSPPPSCVANSTCSNTNGSYLCACNPGFHPLPDGTCTDSPECWNNTYGPNCTYQCQCNFNNTVSCHPVTGNCTCSPGWADPRCDTDIDECSTDTHNCSDPLEACVNTIGGFECVCTDGYEKNISNSCQPCASGKFGTNCSSVCTCAAENTISCSNVDGTCTCKSGWNGTNCSQDIDECAQSPPPSCVANSTCSNTNGSYACVCNPGFHPLPDGTCTDDKVFQSDLYPYGSSNGDQLLPEGDDEVYTIDVTSGIPYGDRTYYSFYLGINGLITFDQRDSGLGVQLYNHIKMFSPYQADIITRGGYGQIWYQIYSRRRDARALFERADKEIMEFLDLKKFKAKLVIVITWDRVSHYSNRNNNNRVTFQTVLISDGEMTYALVYYKKDSMLWNPRVTTSVVMGYSDGNKRPNSITRSSYSYTSVAITSMGTLQGNTGRQGTWAYKVGEKYSPDQICEDWYQTYLPDVGFYHSLDSWIPRCPCNFHQLGWRWTFHRYINEINALCFNIQYSSGWRFYPYGRDCCYSITGNFWTWVQGIPYAGGITAYNPTYNLQLNKEHDRDPHDACCGPSSTIASCMKYYTLRPYGWCTTVPTSEDAWSWGDPHILTLDGVEYTFNGWGEYTMLKIDTENVTFRLQCRTDRAETENGTQTDATIFSAFAMAENGVRVFVQLDPNDNRSLIIYANSSDESRNFRDRVNFTLQTTAFSLRRDNNSLGVLFGASGIGITVVPGIKALDISVDMPIIFRNQTKGLLGNFNGNQLDDFILPNGTVLPSNMTDRQKFEDFGSHWAISSNESLFRYENRLGPANYSHPDFKPIFLDEFTPEERHNASTVCGGNDKLACIYDYLVTGNKEMAEATKQFQETASDVNLANRNTVPELNATGIINATGNSPIVFQLFGEDQDNDNITYYCAGSTSNNVLLDNMTGLVKYTPNIHEPVYLGFFVVDSKNAASSVMVVTVAICSGCSDNGVCDFNNLRNTSSQAFQIASCVCHEAWTGEECDQDRDACLENPCVSGQNCTDLTPDQQGNSSIGYNCSACPRGFEVNTTTNKCQDVDECFVDNVCGQICNNTEGSFLCSCNHGYRLGVDGKSCLDINECAEKTDGCGQICTNYPGGFNCSCHLGYIYQDMNKTCVQDSQTATNCSNFNCTQECRMANGNPECFCLQGYTLLDDNRTCADIDECRQNICSQGCNNTVGSFTCTCYVGYQLDSDKTTCNECPDMYYGQNCIQVCDCNGRHTGCDKVRGCICGSGWTGSFCERDIDECQETPNICGNVREVCVNTNGSYRCDCQSGYTRGRTQSCIDINECDPVTGLSTCGALEDCVNTDGSYYCTCKSGYYKHNGNSNCTDIDECGSSDLCEQICMNTDGSYNCECNYGYRLNVDRYSCLKVADPCKDEEGLTCDQGCTLLETNKAICFCLSGYRLGPDFQSCVDIDECANFSGGCSHTCRNTPGSFQCSCPVGFRMDNDRKTCLACGTGTYGENCANNCACGVGANKCDSVSGCVCSSGWIGSRCDQDIDECQTLSVVQECQSKNAICINFPGSHSCDCESGYQQNPSGICEDTDECLNGTFCSQTCENFPGGYRCLCNRGFTLDDEGNCKDEDECALPTTNRCQQQCINTAGSYFCHCNQPGYELDNDGFSCIARVTCHNNTCPSLNGGCSVVNGTDTCFCHSGYYYNQTINNCTEQVLSWCQHAGCQYNCSEIQELPRFQCQCPDGYLLNNDQKTCRMCVAGTFGQNCSSPCICDAQNTVNCSNVDGTCTCKSGWNGTKCDEDINECAQSPHPFCVANSTCSNTNGSYLCVCNIGYQKLTDGNCTECTGNSYGDNCGSPCQCNVTNTVSCHHVTGNCTCRQGWEGLTCDKDIDECSLQTNNNCNGQHENCTNTIGSYYCVCNKGYQYNTSMACEECTGNTYGTNCKDDCKCNVTNTASCHHVTGLCTCRQGWEGATCDTDIDECFINASACNVSSETCNNTLGGYECLCLDGYQKDAFHICRECTNNTYGQNCSHQCQCNLDNTESCDHVAGNCTCKNEWEGPTCDTDIDECVTNTYNCSDPHATCNNTVGGYDCLCVDGYQKDSSGICEQCANNTFGTNCSHQCQCSLDNTVSCDHVTGNCTCKIEWEGPTCDTDIDECVTNTYNCSDSHETCNNTVGGYDCLCQDGYQKNSYGICEQCTNNTYGSNCSSQCQCNIITTVSCHHVTGNCTCQQGWTGAACDVDIDECSVNASICNGPYETCNNTLGGYDCLCMDGYHKNGTNTCTACASGIFGTNCSSVCTCAAQNTVNCSNVDGTCTCKSGWNGANCDQDIDECAQSPPPSCVANSTCSNTNGSYLCVCNPGFRPLPDGTCTDLPVCSNNTYGPNCTYQCQCNFNNTVSCHPVTGNCTCSPGWADPRCDTDIDECSTDTHNCSDPLEVCVNTIGSFHCVCIDGYEKNISNSCQPCDSGKFGTNCSSVCTCASQNTVNCSNVDGTCTCKSGWNGANCDQDIDECAQSPPPPCVANSTCSNTNGSYACVCNSGFRPLPNETCTRLAPIPLALTLNGGLPYSKEELQNKSSDAFQNVSTEIIRELWKNLKKLDIDDTISDIIIISIRKGSVIIELVMVVDNQKHPDAVSQVANKLPQLREANFTIHERPFWLSNLTINNVTINNACDILNEGFCNSDEICDPSDDMPSCKSLASSLNLELVIGLSVGIPLFVIIVTIIAFLVYRRVKKRKASSRRTISDDNQSEISTIFSRRLPIFGMLRHQRMYKPDDFSETSNEENKYEHYRRRTSDPGYSDSSPWTTRRLKESKRLAQCPDITRSCSRWTPAYNQCHLPIQPCTHDTLTLPEGEIHEADTEEPASFSWDHFYQTAVPEEEFHIKRPQISVSPNPTYQISIQTPSLDEA